jgi:hypothetical protein
MSMPITTAPSVHPDLDTPDELALRHLLLGIVYRTLRQFSASRAHLVEARKVHDKIAISTWIGGVAMFELAVMELKEAEASEHDDGSLSSISSPGSATASISDANSALDSRSTRGSSKYASDLWGPVLKSASAKLDEALSLAPNNIDLSSRLESRVAMLRDEIVLKREMLGF